jgi:hypothetical protein
MQMLRQIMIVVDAEPLLQGIEQSVGIVMLIRKLLLHGIFQDKKIQPSASWRISKLSIQSCDRWRTTPYVMSIQSIISPVSSSIVPNGARLP